MDLSIIRDGTRYPYSLAELRRDNPNVTFPNVLSEEMLAPFGVIIEKESAKDREAPKNTSVPVAHVRIPKHRFIWGLRSYNVYAQWCWYVNQQQGYAKDYWDTTPYVVKSNSYVQHFAEYYNLKAADLDAIWNAANSIEE